MKNEKKNKFFQEYTDCTLVEQYLRRIKGAENSYRTRERFLQVDRSAGRSEGRGVRRERDDCSSIVDGIPPFYARSRNERINDTSQDYSESVVADPLNTGRPCVTVIPEVVVDETGETSPGIPVGSWSAEVERP